MNPIKYLKKNGIRHTLEIVYVYKLEDILERLMYLVTRNIELKDTIMIESHNDFDCNGGAFYNYLIKNGYNRKYKIVWLVRKKVTDDLPENVETVPLYGPNLRKAYYVCTSKYFTFDCENVRKMRDEQIMVYCERQTSCPSICRLHFGSIQSVCANSGKSMVCDLSR